MSLMGDTSDDSDGGLSASYRSPTAGRRGTMITSTLASRDGTGTSRRASAVFAAGGGGTISL